MKRTLIAAATTAVVMTSGHALAQTAVIEIAPEQRTVIREYVVKQRVKPTTIKTRVAVGTTLPADVALVAVPGEWGPAFTRYRYVYSDNRVVLVDPADRRVVQIID